MKPKSNRLGMYADVREVLDTALASGGGQYVLESYGQAIHWRQRAYKFRKLFAELLGPNRESPYDRLILREPKPDTSTIVIVLGAARGTFIPNHEVVPSPEMEEYAKEVAAKIERGEIL